MIYFLVQAYRKKIDEEHNSHLYPSYLTSYDMCNQFGLQTGTYDALKFISEETAKVFMEKAINIFGETREFEIVPFDERIFGRAKQKYIIS